MSADFSWLPSSSLDETPSIKEETTEPVLSSIPPSDTSSSINSPYPRRHSTVFSACTQRVRLYPFLNQSTPPYSEIDSIMSSTSSSGTWSHSGTRGGRSHTPGLRSTQIIGPGTDATYSSGPHFVPNQYDAHLANMRPGSSSSSDNSSSLSGAIGPMSSHPRHSHSPPAPSESSYAANWGPYPQQLSVQHSHAYPGMVGNVEVGTHLPYDIPTTNRNPSPGSNSSRSSDAMFVGDPYSSRQEGAFHYQSPPSSSSGDERLKTEINQLRRRVHELEAERARNYAALGAHETGTIHGHGGLPTPPPSASFVASWKARTDSRKRVFCALNRAGNALCAWHDSRRERRAHPPRNAPPGYLNCGCTHEEALFEESLARHNVGSYHPGENVRMDPALRNPLLKLLQHRYGYLDGDFERNPITGDWAEGEGAAYWEQQAQAHVSGSSSRRRVDTDRH